MEKRSETIRYSKTKNMLTKTRESAIQSRLKELDAKICNDVNLNQHILAEYESLKKELHELYEQKGRGAIFRSKVGWIEKGEKPTKYFFNLMKKNYELTVLSNWRPMTLLNTCTDYKILAKAIAKRIPPKFA